MVLKAVDLASAADCPRQRMRERPGAGTWFGARPEEPDQAGSAAVPYRRNPLGLTRLDDATSRLDVEVVGDERNVGKIQDLRSMRQGLRPAL